jgi:hypothetical protein
MGNVTYLGGRNGQNPALERAKATALELQNELNRLKLEKLKGNLVEKDKVKFLIGNSLVVLRARILEELPRQLTAQLRGHIEHAHLHGIRMKIEETARKWLHETASALEQSADPQKAIDALDKDNETVEDERVETARELKRETLNRRRREKRRAKRDS